MNIPKDVQKEIDKVAKICEWAPRNIIKEFRDEAVAALSEAVLDGHTLGCFTAETTIKRIDGVAAARFKDWKSISYGLH
jgi:hypothetical protein